MDFTETDAIQHDATLRHWYYRAKYGILRQSMMRAGCELPADVVDVGCGVGVFLKLLELDGLLRTESSYGVDPGASPGTTVFNSEIPIEGKRRSGDDPSVVLFMDVLEHVENPIELLQMSLEGVKKGTFVFITVPALPMLWSSHDVALGHFRRYTITSLREEVEAAGGLEIEELYYFYGSILPIVALVRWCKRLAGGSSESDLSPDSSITRWILGWILRGESLIARFNKVAGLTAVAVCRKC